MVLSPPARAHKEMPPLVPGSPLKWSNLTLATGSEGPADAARRWFEFVVLWSLCAESGRSCKAAVGDPDQLAAGRPSVPPLLGILLHAFLAPVNLGLETVCQRLNSKRATSMFTTTVNAFAGYNIVATQGTVFGSSAESMGVGGAAAAIAGVLAGGNVASIKSSIDKARDDAYNNMCNAASQRGANAVIGMSCEIQVVVDRFIGAYCYSTAVTLAPPPPG